jgi:chromosome segregation protein
MQGFKSFAEPITIEFQEGVTCVVGPNGSGKSNIADAIRWVLGEQSPKALRGGKMEEVIFAGTAARKPKGMAEVTLVVDNSAGILPVGFSEVAIRRRMYRSGESEYSINGARCRLRDVRELIMDTGIGVDGYSIISQGRISEIVNSRPENRRELFDEAAGITKYRAKKEESERKLESASANLERIDDIIDEIESRMGGLKEDSEKAKEYLGLRDRHRELEINITLRSVESIQLKNEYISDELVEADGRIDGIREEKSGLDAEAAAGRARSEELEREAEETRARLMANAAETSEAQSRARVNEERRQAAARDKKRLAEEIAQLAERLGREEEGMAAMAESAAAMKLGIEGLAAQLDEASARAAERAAGLAELSGEIDSRKNDIFEFHRQRAAKESEAASIESLGEALVKRRAELRDESAAADESGRETQAAIDAALARADEAGAALERLGGERAAAEESLAARSRREDELAGLLRGMEMERGQLSARKKTIEEMESNYEGYSQGVRFVMKSGLKGLRGVVAELVEAPKGMETAVETALGGAMHNIVCDGDESAKAAIRLLKENRAGRLTFLPISSMRAPGGALDGRVRGAAGCLGRASELVGFAPELKGVFEYLLGRVVIMDSLDNAAAASKAAPGGLRFVTLDGEVINAAGAMTGGAYRNRSANLLERRAEIAELSRRLDGMAGESEGLALELGALREGKAAAADALRRCEAALRETELEQAAAGSELKSLMARREDISGARQRLLSEIRGLELEQERSLEMAGSVGAEIERLKLAEDEAGLLVESAMQRHESEKAAADSLGESVTDIRLRLGAAESEKQGCDALMARFRESVAELAASLGARREALDEAARQESELAEGDFDIEAFVAERAAERAGLERRLEAAQESRAKAARLADSLAERKAALDAALEAEHGRKYEAEIRRAKNDAQLEAMKERLWDEFEISLAQAAEFRKDGFVMAAALRESREIRSRIKGLGEINVGAIREYEAVSERYGLLASQRADLVAAMDSLRGIIADTDRAINESFRASFDKVVENFSETFGLLFGGGKGELRLEDESRPLDCGIEINAQPPGKRLQNMNLLSGGEKTMTAIALMFSILKAKPTPFCILDEVEAALDDSNIVRFADYLANFRETQFTLVTHQKTTMEYADALYGVTMPEEGVSKVISLRLGDAETERFADSL